MGSFVVAASPLSFSFTSPINSVQQSSPDLPLLLLPQPFLRKTKTRPFSFQAKPKAVSLSSSNTSNWKLHSSMADNISTDKKKENVTIFETEQALSVALAEYITVLSQKYVISKGSFTVVLSGGTMIHSLRKLVQLPFVESIDWRKWRVFWLDERVVPIDDVESNYNLAYAPLLSKVPIPCHHIYAINEVLAAEGAADAAAHDYEKRLKHLVGTKQLNVSPVTGFPEFDLLLLGMGPDGHVASLFPGNPQRLEKDKMVTFINDSPKLPPKRITLTFPVINSGANIALVITGAEVAHVLGKVLGNQNHNYSDDDLLPIKIVSPVHGAKIWFLDKLAASEL